VLTAGAVHGAADNTNTIASANATNWATALTLINEFKNTTAYEAHRILIAGTVHGVADAVNAITADDAGYPQATGGFPLNLATVLPGKTILGVSNGIVIGGDIGCVFDRTAGKLKCFVLSTGAEVADKASAAALDTELSVFSI